MSDFDDEYTRLTIWLHHTAEQAEAHVERADRLIRKLTDSGLLAEGVILGPIIHARGTPPAGAVRIRPNSSRRSFTCRRGSGWCSGTRRSTCNSNSSMTVGGGGDVQVLAVRGVRPGDQGLFLPHLPGLMDRLKKRLP